MSQLPNYLGNFGNQLGSQIGNYFYPPEDQSQVQIPDGTQIDHTLPSGRARNLPPGFSGQTVEAGQFFEMPDVGSQSSQSSVPTGPARSSQVNIPGYTGMTVEAGSYFEPTQAKKRETDYRYTDLAKTLAQSNYFIANDIDQAVQIPVEERDQFLRDLYNESVKQKEKNKDRGLLSGVWDNFSLGRGQAYTSLMSLPNTLGYERVPDEEVQFVNDIMSIRSQVTDPENQNWFQYGAEGAARMAPDLLSMLAIGSAGGPYAAASFSAARTAPDLEQAMVDLDVNPSIRKPLAVVGAIPIAALELVGAGAVFRPLKTQAVKRVQDAVAEKTLQMLGTKGNKVLNATGNYASDLTVEMTQEFAQGITEASVTSFGKVLQEGGFTEEATKAAKQQYTSNIASVLDATLPMAFLVGGGRLMERIVNIPQDLDFVGEEDIPQVTNFIEENPQETQRLLESETLSRKDAEKIGISKPTNVKERKTLQGDLRKIVKANQYDFSQLFSGAPITPSMDIDQAVRDQLGDQRRQPQEVEAEYEMAAMEARDAYRRENTSVGPDAKIDDFNPIEIGNISVEESLAGDRQTISDTLGKLNNNQIDEMVGEYGLDISSEDNNLKLKRGAILEKELEINSVAYEAGLHPEQLKKFVNDWWYSKEKAEQSDTEFFEELELFTDFSTGDSDLRDAIAKEKNFMKRERLMDTGGLFGTGIDIHKMGYNRLRTLASRLSKETKSDPPAGGSRPKKRTLQNYIYSKLQKPDVWKYVDASEFAGALERSGKVPGDYLPGDYARKLIMDHLERQIDKPGKWSYEFLKETADLYQDNKHHYVKAKAEEALEKKRTVNVGYEDVGGFGPSIEQVPVDQVQVYELMESDFLKEQGLFDGNPLSAAAALIRKPSRNFDPAEEFFARAVTPEQKTALDVNNGKQDATFWQKLSVKIKKRFNQFTRRYEFLDMSKTKSRIARQLLRVLNGRIGNAVRYAESTIGAITDGMSASEKRLFEALVYYEDMWAQYQEVGDRRVLRLGNNELLSPQKVKNTLDHLREAPGEFPIIGEALDRRRRLYTPIVKKLVDKGQLPEAALDDINKYIHRMVMIHQRGSKQYMDYLKKMGKDTMSLTDKAGQIQSDIIETVQGYQISRRTDKDLSSSLYDYNTNIIETDFDWVSNALVQLEVLDFLDHVKSKLDVTPQLKAQADRENMVAWLGGQAKYDQIIQKRIEGAELVRQKKAGEIDSKDYRLKRMPITKWLEENDPSTTYRRRMSRAIAGAKEALGIDGDDFSQNWNQIFSEAKETNPNSVVSMYGLQYFKALKEQEAQMKEDLGPITLQTVEKIVDADGKYDFFLPGPGSRFYTVLSISDSTQAYIQQAILEGVDINPEDIKTREALAVAPGNKMVLPTDIANEFNSMKVEEDYSWAVTREWKKAVLLAPFRLPGYMIRNMFGDREATIQGLLGDMKLSNWNKARNLSWNIGKYNDEIVKYRSKGMKLPKRLQDIEKLINNIFSFDVVGSSRIMADMKLNPELRKFARKDATVGVGKLANTYNGYMNLAGRMAEFAENHRRIHAYLEFRDMLDRHQKKGDPINYGASNRKLIDTTLREFGPDATAAQLARDLAGDYGETTVAVAKLSQNWLPFAKFQGINLEREIRLTANNFWGLITATKAEKPKHAAMLLARMIKPALAYAIWNHWFFPDEEENLSLYDRANPHVILGVRDDGSPVIARNFSTTGDFLEWFGLNSFPSLLRLAYNGQISKSDLIAEMMKDPFNKLVGAITPAVKMPMEAVVGMTLFPDATDPRAADRGEIIASTVMNKESFKAVRGYLMGSGETGRPQNFAWQSFFGMSVSDPNVNMLNDTYAYIEKFKDSKGIPSSNYSTSPTKDMKRAAQFGDRGAFIKAKNYFVANGGDSEKFLNSIRSYDPVGRLSDEYEKEFMTEFLDSYQARRVEMSRDYAKRMQSLMWNWWAEDEKIRTGSKPPKFTSQIASKLSSLAANHRSPTNSNGVPWEEDYKNTVEWLKYRGITKDEAIASLRENLKSQRKPLSSIAPKLRLARVRLTQNGL